VIGVEFGRDARQILTGAGLEVTYRETPMSHTIDPEYIPELREWLTARIPVAAS
jgi:predicted esterase